MMGDQAKGEIWHSFVAVIAEWSLPPHYNASMCSPYHSQWH